MRLRTIQIKSKPKEGDMRQHIRFAWWPTKIADKLIWLEKYIIIEKFVIRERIHAFQGYGFLKVKGGGWDEVERKLINRSSELIEGGIKSNIKSNDDKSPMANPPKPVKPEFPKDRIQKYGL